VWPRGYVDVYLYCTMTAALEGGEWSAALPGRPLPPGKTRYPLYSRLGGSQGRSGRAENLVPTGIRSRTVQPVASRYTDWATRLTICNNIILHKAMGSILLYYTWLACVLLWHGMHKIIGFSVYMPRFEQVQIANCTSHVWDKWFNVYVFHECKHDGIPLCA